jgi:ABC-type methionine transport system permease subunit
MDTLLMNVLPTLIKMFASLSLGLILATQKSGCIGISHELNNKIINNRISISGTNNYFFYFLLIISFTKMGTCFGDKKREAVQEPRKIAQI